MEKNSQLIDNLEIYQVVEIVKEQKQAVEIYQVLAVCFGVKTLYVVPKVVESL